MSFKVMVDFNKIYPEDEDDISILTDDSFDSDPRNYLQGFQNRK